MYDDHRHRWETSYTDDQGQKWAMCRDMDCGAVRRGKDIVGEAQSKTSSDNMYDSPYDRSDKDVDYDIPHTTASPDDPMYDADNEGYNQHDYY